MDGMSGNRLAVVTGGARGIGRAICLALARDGTDIMIADLNSAGAEETGNAVRGLGRTSRAWKVDISEEGAVEHLFAEIVDLFGPPDILVNNAGICQTASILDLRSPDWDRILAVNLRGTFLASREAFRVMKERRGGKIISISSTAAKLGGLAVGAHYAASKAGIIALAKSLALEAAPYRINVNVVCPGPTETEMTKAWGEATNRSLAARIPWQEYGQAEDVAEAVVFLASEKARYITGEVLDVNGGLVMD
jgi:3-oxoacyl-[acyl-carrier protein] reductase